MLPDTDVEKLREIAKDPNIVEKLIKSFAPTINGLDDVKEGMLLSAVSNGYNPKFDGTYQSGFVHTCIYGTLETVKAQLKLALRDVIPSVTLLNNTSENTVGLKTVMIKDRFNKIWNIEACIVSLADGSGIIIDELDKLQKDIQWKFKKSLIDCHLEVEGHYKELWTECFVILMINFTYGKLDRYEPLVKQINIPYDLFTKFDLVLIDPENLGEEKSRQINTAIATNNLPDTVQDDQDLLSVEDLKKYIALARAIKPDVITPNSETEKLIIEEFLRARGHSKDDRDYRDAVPIPYIEKNYSG